jgi:hypothetical protein
LATTSGAVLVGTIIWCCAFWQQQHIGLCLLPTAYNVLVACRTSEGASTSGTDSSAANAGYLQQKLVYTPDGDKLLDADGERYRLKGMPVDKLFQNTML